MRSYDLLPRTGPHPFAKAAWNWMPLVPVVQMPRCANGPMILVTKRTKGWQVEFSDGRVPLDGSCIYIYTYIIYYVLYIMSLNQDSSRNLLVLIDMFHFWWLDDSYLTSSANFAITIKLPGLLMNLRQSGNAASFDVYTGGVLCRSGTLPRILRSWWKEVFLASTWTPQELQFGRPFYPTLVKVNTPIHTEDWHAGLLWPYMTVFCWKTLVVVVVFQVAGYLTDYNASGFPVKYYERCAPEAADVGVALWIA